MAQPGGLTLTLGFAVNSVLPVLISTVSLIVVRLKIKSDFSLN